MSVHRRRGMVALHQVDDAEDDEDGSRDQRPDHGPAGGELGHE